MRQDRKEWMRAAVIGFGLCAAEVDGGPQSGEHCYSPNAPEFSVREIEIKAEAEAAALKEYQEKVCGYVDVVLDDYVDPETTRRETIQEGGDICIAYLPSENPLCPTFERVADLP